VGVGGVVWGLGCGVCVGWVGWGVVWGGVWGGVLCGVLCCVGWVWGGCEWSGNLQFVIYFSRFCLDNKSILSSNTIYTYNDQNVK
jgi:hypothetical protein